MRSIAPCSSPPPWTRAATAAPRRVPASTRVATGGLLVGGIVAIAIGSYGLLDSTAPRYLGSADAAGRGGARLGGRGVERPPRSSGAATGPTRGGSRSGACPLVGVAVAAVMVAVSTVDPTALHPSLQPLRWPELPLAPAAAVLLGLLPAWIAPPVRLPAVTPVTVVAAPQEHAA